MPESPRDLRTAVHTANEAIRNHARIATWTEPDQVRHAVLVQAWQTALAKLGAATADDEARPAAA